jgi:hypothetical protein
MLKLVADTWFGLSSTAWDGIAAMATAAAFAAAVVGALLVLRQLKQARDLAEEQARPYLVAMIEESAEDWTLADFVVRNIGQTAARDIAIALDPPYVRVHDLGEGNQFMGAAFISGRTSVLPPGGEIRTYFDSARELSAAMKGEIETTQPFTTTLRYRDRLGKEITESFEIDPYARLGTMRTDVHGLHHLAKTLRAWTKSQDVNNY